MATGGLEAGIAAHVINNVFAYLIAGLTTSVAALKAIRGSAGWTLRSTSAGSPCSRVLAYVLSRLMKLRTRVHLS